VLVSNQWEYWSNYLIRLEILNIRTALDKRHQRGRQTHRKRQSVQYDYHYCSRVTNGNRKASGHNCSVLQTGISVVVYDTESYSRWQINVNTIAIATLTIRTCGYVAPDLLSFSALVGVFLKMRLFASAYNECQHSAKSLPLWAFDSLMYSLKCCWPPDTKYQQQAHTANYLRDQ